MTADSFRAADSRCGHPTTITAEQAAPDHKLGYYLSTYCEHRLGDNCRLTCKTCHAPCACLCHGAGAPAPNGFSVEEEDRMRDAARRIAREMGVPTGPRGDELIASIVSGVLFYAERDAADEASRPDLAEQMKSRPTGVYRLFWRSSGCSVAAVGMLTDGSRWYSPANWSGADPAGVVSTDWSRVKQADLIESWQESRRKRPRKDAL